MKYAINLQNGQTVEGELLSALEADFEKMTWTFSLDGETQVSGGDYIVIHTKDLERAAVAAQGKPADEVKP